MGIKCSLLGHRFGETSVERDREEDGTEVVITITEYETCTRCGETRVVSENKEVTTLEETDAGAGTDSTPSIDDAAPAGASSGDDGTDADADVADGHDAEIIDGTGKETSAQANARGAAIPDAEAGTGDEPTTDPDEDDAVVIDGDSGTVEAEASATGDGVDDGSEEGDGDERRQPGEWPEEPDGRNAAQRAGETAEAEILGDSDEESDADGDAAVTGAGGTEAGTVGAGSAGSGTDAGAASEAEPTGGGRATGVDDTGDENGADADAGRGTANAAVGVDPEAAAWPEEADDVTSGSASDVMGDWPEETKRDEGADPSATGPSLDGDDPGAVTVPEGMFKCTECGFTTEVESSSLRAGDFCPECHRGTLLQDTDADDA